MNWRDSEAFVNTVVAQGLSESTEEEIERFWRIWQAAAGYGAQETWESVRANGAPPGISRKVVLGVPEDVLEKARRLQALAMDEAAAPQERENAWAAFSKIWKEHKLPGDFGL